MRRSKPVAEKIGGWATDAEYSLTVQMACAYAQSQRRGIECLYSTSCCLVCRPANGLELCHQSEGSERWTRTGPPPIHQVRYCAGVAQCVSYFLIYSRGRDGPVARFVDILFFYLIFFIMICLSSCRKPLRRLGCKGTASSRSRGGTLTVLFFEPYLFIVFISCFVGLTWRRSSVISVKWTMFLS